VSYSKVYLEDYRTLMISGDSYLHLLEYRMHVYCVLCRRTIEYSVKMEKSCSNIIRLFADIQTSSICFQKYCFI